jgi:hypothetical protein
MLASIPVPPRTLGFWLIAFFSPTIYFLLLLVADRFHVPSLPDAVVAMFFYALPLLALAICESLIWCSRVPPALRLRGMILTVAAMLVQFAVVLAILTVAAR